MRWMGWEPSVCRSGSCGRSERSQLGTTYLFTGQFSHFQLMYFFKVKCWSLSCVQFFVTPWTVAYQAPLWEYPDKNTGVGCHFLLQGIFPTPGWNPALPHCRQTFYQLSRQGSLSPGTKVRLVKAMVFPVVMYGCESWIIKKAKHQRIGAFELWCGRRLLRVPWTARKSNQSILKDISPEYSLEGLILKMKLRYFGHLI